MAGRGGEGENLTQAALEKRCQGSHHRENRGLDGLGESGDPCDSHVVAGNFPTKGSLAVVWFFNLSVQCDR